MYVNGKQLRMDEFSGINEKAIIVSTPPKLVTNMDDIHLMIVKQNLIDTITKGHDPLKESLTDVLLDTRMRYAQHGEYKDRSHSRTFLTYRSHLENNPDCSFRNGTEDGDNQQIDQLIDY